MIARAWRTPLGSTVDAVMARLRAGERAGSTDPRIGYGTAIAPIPGQPAPSRQSRFLRRMGLFGLEVAAEAFAASGLVAGPRIGLFSGVGGLRVHWDDMTKAFAEQRDDGALIWERGLEDVHPYWMLRHLSNNVHALASVELGLRGEGATFGGGNGGAQALAAASRALHDDAIDAALVVAYDSLLEPETLVERGARGEVAIPGEAAAAIVVVRERAGCPRVRVREAAGPGALARCIAFGDHATDDARPLTDAMGELGAATALVQAIALSERSGRTAFGLATSAPDLASAIVIELADGPIPVVSSGAPR